MAFTFSGQTLSSPVQGGVFTASATTDTSSAAGSIVVPFAPSVIQVFDQTNANKYEWNNQMAAASMQKTVTAGTFTYVAAAGITVTGPTSATAVAFTVTLGTALHTNTSTYRIVCVP